MQAVPDEKAGQNIALPRRGLEQDSKEMGCQDSGSGPNPSPLRALLRPSPCWVIAPGDATLKGVQAPAICAALARGTVTHTFLPGFADLGPRWGGGRLLAGRTASQRPVLRSGLQRRLGLGQLLQLRGRLHASGKPCVR